MSEADKAKAAPDAAKPRPTQSSTPDTPEEVRYSRDELRDRARAFLGVSPHAVAGALEGDDRETFTLEQAEKLVNRFRGREVVSEAEQEAEAA